jgi:hypothetical protein
MSDIIYPLTNLIRNFLEQNRDIKIANRSFENVEEITYLGMTLTKQNRIHKEIISR